MKKLHLNERKESKENGYSAKMSPNVVIVCEMTVRHPIREQKRRNGEHLSPRMLNEIIQRPNTAVIAP